MISDSEESNSTTEALEGEHVGQADTNEWEDERVLETPNPTAVAKVEERLRSIIEAEIISINTAMAQREALGLSPLRFEPLPLCVAQPDQSRPSQPSEELSVLRILYDPGGPEVAQEVHLGSSMEESPPDEQLLTQCGLQLRRKEKGKVVKGDSSTSKEMKRLAWFVNEVPDRRGTDCS
ncbi:hypothetical protein Sjap_011451 [Stephania japonica]|uniref:Uncharacterized protein n=1 Tax=Stephania japonica TaxID=461633 RepID=A0AAP0JBE7_9MAGN